MTKTTLHLIDRERLVRQVQEQAHVGGEERLLSEREVVSLIRDSFVWEEKEVTVL